MIGGGSEAVQVHIREQNGNQPAHGKRPKGEKEEKEREKEKEKKKELSSSDMVHGCKIEKQVDRRN